METQWLDMRLLPSMCINSPVVPWHHTPLPSTVPDVWVFLEYLNPAEMTDGHGCRRSLTDMSFLVEASHAGLRKSKDLVNKCSEAVKMNCSYHPNSFISLANDLFNSLCTQRDIIQSGEATLCFHMTWHCQEYAINSPHQLLDIEKKKCPRVTTVFKHYQQ